MVPSNATLTFEHTYTWWGNKRKLRVLAQPNVTLGWGHVPAHCRRARTILLGPLMPQDIDCKSFVHKVRGKPSQFFFYFPPFTCMKQLAGKNSWVIDLIKGCLKR